MCVYMYICRVIYLFVKCILVGYICMFLFTVEDRITIHLDYYIGLILRIFILIVTTRVCKLTVLFVHILKF